MSEKEQPKCAPFGEPKPPGEPPKCPKHGNKMVYADGTQPYHDLKTPHWRCELWVGGGVCGLTLPFTPAAAS